MSLGDVGDIGTCSDGGVREAICKSVAAGVVYVAAAGNSSVDASTFIPAAFPEVIAVSAMTDFDGKPGGLAGCQFILVLFGYYCDDQLAAFTNFGSTIAVTAPGVQVYSTWKGGGYATESGTSMAAPHVTGVVALMRAANQSLTAAQIENLLKLSGDMPDGSTAESGCGSTAQWGGDSDGIAEPIVNALRAAQRAVNPTNSAYPVVTLTPGDGANVGGDVNVSATATHSSGIASVQFFLDGASLGTDTSAPYQVNWDTSSTFDGHHVLVARATAVSGQFACATSHLMVGPATQGDWVGTYGVDGYALGAWNGPGTSDLAVLPNATLTIEQGARYSWVAPTSDVRALQRPDGSERRQATGWYDAHPARACGSTSARPTAARSTSTPRLGHDRPADERHRDRRHARPRPIPITTSYHDGAPGCTSRSTCPPAASSGSPPTSGRQQRHDRGPVPGRRRRARRTAAAAAAALCARVKGNWVGHLRRRRLRPGRLERPGHERPRRCCPTRR